MLIKDDQIVILKDSETSKETFKEASQIFDVTDDKTTDKENSQDLQKTEKNDFESNKKTDNQGSQKDKIIENKEEIKTNPFIPTKNQEENKETNQIPEPVLLQKTLSTEENFEKSAILIQKQFRANKAKLQDFRILISQTKYYKKPYEIKVLSNQYNFELKVTFDNSYSVMRIPVKIIETLSKLESKNRIALSYYLINISKYFDKQISIIKNPNSAKDFFVNKIKNFLKKKILSLSRKRGKEALSFEHKTSLIINNESFSIKTQVFDSYLSVCAENNQETFDLYMKSQILKGYPSDFPIKEILKQHIYPRLYFKAKNDGKRLHGIKKFEISKPIKGVVNPNLILQTTKTLNSQLYTFTISKLENSYEIASNLASPKLLMHLPIKETKIYPNINLLCTHILLRLKLTKSKLLCMFEETENRVYMIMDVWLNSKLYSVSVNKEEQRCLVHAFCLENSKESLLFLDNLSLKNDSVEEFILALDINVINNEDSLILKNWSFLEN